MDPLELGKRNRGKVTTHLGTFEVSCLGEIGMGNGQLRKAQIHAAVVQILARQFETKVSPGFLNLDFRPSLHSPNSNIPNSDSTGALLFYA